MTDKAEVIIGISPEMEREVISKAKERARNGRWDLNIAIFLFAILIMVIILATYTKAGIEVVASVAAFGLLMVWLVGWRREKQLYHRFYEEELFRAEQAMKKTLTGAAKETLEEAIDKKIQRALRERQ